MEKKRLKSLIEDFKHYAFILLAVSTFIYIGAVLPGQGLTAGQKMLMFVTDCVFLAGAYFCVDRSLIKRGWTRPMNKKSHCLLTMAFFVSYSVGVFRNSFPIPFKNCSPKPSARLISGSPAAFISSNILTFRSSFKKLCA